MKRYSCLMLTCLFATVVAVTIGCDGRPQRVPIAGTVLIDGKPLTKGNITVIPANARAARAMIDSQGRFRLTTFDEHDGAVLGEHAVAIVSTENVGGNGLRWLVPKKYKDTTSSGLTIKVEQPTKDMRIELTWDGGRPFVEISETAGDVAPVGAVPVEPAAP